MAIDLKSKIKAYWENLDAAGRKGSNDNYHRGLMVFGIAVYYIKFGNKDQRSAQGQSKSQTRNKVGTYLLEKLRICKGQEKINTMLKEVEDLKKEVKDSKNQQAQNEKIALAESKINNKHQCPPPSPL